MRKSICFFRKKNLLISTRLHLNRHSFFSSDSSNHYDLVVIGGGSGGLACSKEASSLGKKVAVLDYVEPSLRGTKWGLGGTCVNVGCIPKKLMHKAAIVGRDIHEAHRYGWDTVRPQHSWSVLAEGVQNHIRSLNWGHRVQLKDKKVDYLNATGYLLDNNTVRATTKNGKESVLTADHIIIATGLRPRYPTDVPGAMENAISSDDIFWMKEPPGKTLVIGASYVALECAGFLTGLGYNTSVLIRSIPLRGFDKEMADLVVKEMRHEGTNIHEKCIPTSITRQDDNSLSVSWHNKATDEHTIEDGFNTVLMAIGRGPMTREIGLENTTVATDDEGFIIGNHDEEAEKTAAPNIFAIGDVLKDGPELTPVAIQAGKLLAQRLYDGAKRQMDYKLIPTTVFTPLEYACVGMTEGEAGVKYDKDNIEVYHAYYKPLEYYLPERDAGNCYIKAITLNEVKEKVIGLHITGPNAGEIMQGFAAAVRCGLTKERLGSTIGIHPTTAEEVVKLHITKRSGLDPTVSGC